MKDLKIVTIIACFIMLNSFSMAFAITNEIEFKLMGYTSFVEYKWDTNNGSSDSNDYRENGITYGLGYTLYFDDLNEDDFIPLDLAAFIEHSSFVGISGYLGGYNWESDDDDVESDSEKDWTGFNLYGKGILPFGLGFGGRINTQSGEWKNNLYSDKYDEDRLTFDFSIEQYLGDNNRLGLYFSHETKERTYSDSDNKREYTTDWGQFGYTGALGGSGRFFLQAKIGLGKRDIDNSASYRTDVSWDLRKIDLTIGPALRHFSLYFNFAYTQSESNDDSAQDGQELAFYLRPRIWMGPYFMLGFNLGVEHETWSGSDYEDTYVSPHYEIIFKGRF